MAIFKVGGKHLFQGPFILGILHVNVSFRGGGNPFVVGKYHQKQLSGFSFSSELFVDPGGCFLDKKH